MPHPRLLRSFVWLLALTLPAVAAAADPTDGALEELRSRLDALVRSCRRCRWGVMVKVAGEDRVLFERSARIPFNPASNIKVLTAAAALKGMGSNYRFSTRLLGRRQGTRVVGGLYLQGSGDPSLSETHLAQMAGALQRLGVRAVEGPLLLDTAHFGDRGDPPGFSRFRSSHPFRAGVDALSLNRNVIRITIAPASVAGQRAIVTVAPASSYLKLRGRVLTSRGRTRIWTATFSRRDGTGVNLSGRIRVGDEPRSFWRRVYHPALFTGHTLLTHLASQGIAVEPAVQRREAPADLPVLVEHRSEPLATIVQQGNKASSNVMAELLLLALGATTAGPPATFAKGLEALDGFLREVGIAAGTYRIQNGSGLSRRTIFRPAALVRVLEIIQADPMLGPALVASMPVAGQDGTLRKRFTKSPAAGLIKAKTGTLGGVSCLSGYADWSDRRLIFSFMTGRVRRQRAVRHLHVAMAEALVAYLKRLAGEGPAARPAP